MKHKRIRAGLALSLLILAMPPLLLTSCREEQPLPDLSDLTDLPLPESDGLPGLDPDRVVSSKGITEMIYTEEGGAVIRAAVRSETQAVLSFDAGGSIRTFAAPLTLLDELREIIDRYDMQSWALHEEYTASDGAARSFSMREANRTVIASSDRMPDCGSDAFRHIVRILRSYALPEAERFPKEVILAGKKFRTVNGLSSEIDLRGQCWWKLEEYPGHYELNDAEHSVTLEIEADGTFTLTADGEIHTGTLDEERLDGCMASANDRWMWFCYEGGGQDENRLRIQVAPLPYPETFPGYDFVLERVPAIRHPFRKLFSFLG